MKHTHALTHTHAHTIIYSQDCVHASMETQDCECTHVYTVPPPLQKTNTTFTCMHRCTHMLKRQVLKTRLKGNERRAMTAKGREFQIK